MTHRARLAAAALCLLVVAGCGGASSDASTSTPTPKVVRIVVHDGKVTPQGGRVDVKVGQPITLDISSDASEEVHVHSEPEHEYEIAAGTKDERHTFSITVPGQVAVEAHHLDVTILQLVVTP